MDVAVLYFEVGAVKSLGCCVSSGEWCIKGKQDSVNGNCTVCDFNPRCAVAGLM